MIKKNLRDLSIRILARAIDGALFTAIFLGIFNLANVDFELLGGTVFAVLFMFCWMGVEALLFLVFKNTPGKWFLGVKVTKVGGQELSKFDIVYRSVLLFTLGNGIGYPFVIVGAWLINLVFVLITGKTLYDKIGGFDVQVAEVRKFRVVLVVIIFIIALIGITINDFSSGNTIIINQ